MQQRDVNDLNSPDPQVRKAAVIALGKSKDREALKYLEAVYRTDSDPAIRELARKAGRFIRDHTDPIPEPEEIPITPARAEAASPSPAVPERKISATDRERAKGYLDQALDLSVRHQEAKALQALAKAFTLNPELSNDVMARNLAVELTGFNPQDAIAHLTDSGARRAIVSSRPTESGVRAVLWDDKLKRGEAADAAADQDDWGPALLDLGIYGLVNGALTFVLMLVAFPAFARLMESMMTTAGRGQLPPGALTSIPTAAGLPTALLYGLISAAAAIIGLLILDVAVNLVATTVLGGAGGLVRLIRKTTLFYTLLIPISTVISFVPFLGFANEDLFPILSLLPLFVSLATAIWAGKLTGDAYDFGTGKGCASIFLGGVLLTITIVCFAFTLTFALAQLF